jgi:GMP synthase (glutamine-hydrolysing)
MNDASSAVRVALLDASLGDTPAAANFQRTLDADVTVYKVSEGTFPPSPTAKDRPYDAVVVSGSQTAVYDDHDWIDRTEAWVRDAVDAGLPVLGVCWGHQLLAQALGGTADPMGEYELGYEPIDRLEDDPLFDGVPGSFVAFETHSDEVTELPGDATLLAENDRSLQAFRVRNAWGVQFHPEYDLDTARWVTENKRGDVDNDRVDAILADVTPERHAEAADARRVLDNFVALARSIAHVDRHTA